MRLVFILFCLLVPQYIFSQANNNGVFLTIGNQKITTDEFERIFNKNNSISSGDKQTVEEYLQMYINFKLKVQAAIDAGYDTISSFSTELKGYRDQLAKSYLTDNATVDSLIKEAYQRMHTEVNASHIMVALKANSSPADTVAAWHKIMAIRERLLKGEDFEKLAFELSEDPSAKNNKGSLGYFTAFRMVYPFESAAFNGKIGEISKPVRSQYGYHLIKTVDKRPSLGEVKVAHIMLMVPQGSSDSAWISAEKKIRQIKQQLNDGADFASLAKEKSEDRGSARNGGELPSFSMGGMIPEFAGAAFSLKYPGEISEPVKTFYGWHIIRLLEKKGIPDFDQVKQDIKLRISRDERAEYGSNSLIASLKKEYGFTDDQNLLAELYLPPKKAGAEKSKSEVTATRTKTAEPVKPENKINWNINTSKLQQELFRFADQSYKLESFYNYLKSIQVIDSINSAEKLIKAYYASYVKKVMLDFENTQLENKYPDFKNLIEEYHDGILLFNLSDSIVWSKASKDTAGLEKFFIMNQANYFWPERVDAFIIKCNTPEIAAKAIKATKKIKDITKMDTELIKFVCDTSATEPCLSVVHNQFSKGDNPLIDSISWKKGISPLLKINGFPEFAIINNIIKPSPKTLSESRGLVISDYQTKLDQEWVANLRKKYNISVNNNILNQLKNKYAGKN